MRILLSNPPWGIGSCRAGSRWAHKCEYRKETFLEKLIKYLEGISEKRNAKKFRYRTFPFFLAYAAAVLEKSKFNVKVIDSIATDQNKIDFFKEVMAFNPDLCVFETSTPSLSNDLEIMKEIKKRVGCKTVLTGSHVSALPEDALSNDFVDFVCIGEYEFPLNELAKCLAAKGDMNRVKGIAYKKNGKIKINPRMELIECLDDIPLPAWHLMPMDKYWTPCSKTERSMEILSSRGCPYQCTYCIFPQLIYNSHRVRYRSPKNILDEIEILIKKYGKEGIYFNDDTFTIKKSHVIGICNEIKNRGMKFNWGCFGRVDTVDRDMLEAMKDAGCVLIKYGIESGSQKILDNVKKGYVLDDVRKALKLTKEIGIATHGTFMIGLPGDDSKTLKETLDFAKEVNPDTTVWALVTPFPGTKIYNEAKENGWIEITQWEKYDGENHAVMRTKDMSIKEIEMAWRYIKNEWTLYQQRKKSRIKNFISATYREFGVIGILTKGMAKVLQLLNELKQGRKNKII